MSILDKPLTPPPRRRSRRRPLLILVVIFILLISVLVFTDIRADLAFLVHFFSTPSHFTYSGHSDYVSAVAWSPNGKRIASGDANGLVLVWDALTGNHVYTYRGHADYYPGHFTSGQAVDTVTWSPNGEYIASGSNDMTVQVWQTR